MRSPLPRLGVRGALRLALFTGALACATACATGGDNTVAEGHAGAPGVGRVLVLPLNLAIGLPAELDGTTAPVQAAVAGHIEAQGRAVESLSFREASRQWRIAQETVGAAGFEAAAAALVAALAKDHAFDAVVMPSIVSQTKRVTHLPARWDGVKRKLRQTRVDKVGSVLVVMEVSTQLPVLSLLVQAFAPGGERVFEGRGGLEIPHELVFVPDTGRWSFRFRSDLFEDAELLGESVRVAFDPYLGPAVSVR